MELSERYPYNEYLDFLANEENKQIEICFAALYNKYVIEK